MDGKSIMGILLLAAARGTVITLTANGPTNRPRWTRSCSSFNQGFGEETWSV
jgi:phosphotransferase system HPr-like phosphotransfer protein